MKSAFSHMSPPLDDKQIRDTVQIALAEDIGTGDITAELIPPDQRSKAIIITRNEGLFCGIPWANATLDLVDPDSEIEWHVSDGEPVGSLQTVASLRGFSRGLVTAERTLLNFIQLLSGTATAAGAAAEILERTKTRVLDTRKTVPGLRAAQKYAVAAGGGINHRFGLHDAYLVKENHICTVGGISPAVERARALHPNMFLEIEVEDLTQLEEAIRSGADRVMLDNFDLQSMRDAVALANGTTQLEASGGITLKDLKAIAATGVDFISMGSITKAVEPLDLSMRILSTLEG